MYMMGLTDGGRSLSLSNFWKYHYNHIPKKAFFIALRVAGLLERRANGTYKIAEDKYEIFTKRSSSVGVALDKIEQFTRHYEKIMDSAYRMSEIYKKEK